MSTISTLLVRPLPLGGEGVKGYLLRLANMNGLPSEKRLFSGTERSLPALTKLLGRDDTNFWQSHPQLSYWQLEGARFDQLWNRQSRRYCPQCLMEEPHWRMAWEFRGYTVCHIHHVKLVNTCPKCHEVLAWNSQSLLHCECNGDLLVSDAEACTTEEALLASAIESSCGLGSCEYAIPIVDKVPPKELHNLIHFLGAFGTGLSLRKTTHLLEDWGPIALSAARVLSRWPEGFHEWLDDVKISSLMSGIRLAPTFGPAYHYLYRQLVQNESLIFVRDEFEQYLKHSWRGTLSKRNRRLSPELLANNKWIAAPKASKELSVSRNELKQMIETGTVSGRLDITPSGRERIVVDEDSVAPIKHVFRNMIPLTKASEMLNVDRARMRELCDQGVINYYSRPEAHGKGIWKIYKGDIAALLDRTIGTPIINHPREGEVALRTLVVGMSEKSNKFPRFIHAVAEWRIPVVARLKDEDGLYKWVFRVEDYRAWIKEQRELPEGMFSIQEVSRQLRIKEQVGYELAQKGLLITIPSLRDGRPILLVTTEALFEFISNYVLGRDLAKEIKTSPRALINIFAEAGIKPVTGPGVDNCRQAVFRQSDDLSRAVSFIKVNRAKAHALSQSKLDLRKVRALISRAKKQYDTGALRHIVTI